MPYKHFCFGCTRRNASNNNNEHKKIAVMAHIPNGAPALILYSPMQNDAQRLGKREDQKDNVTTTHRSGKSLKFAYGQQQLSWSSCASLLQTRSHRIFPAIVHSHSQAMKKMQKAMQLLRMTKPCNVRDFVEQVPSPFDVACSPPDIYRNWR